MMPDATGGDRLVAAPLGAPFEVSRNQLWLALAFTVLGMAPLSMVLLGLWLRWTSDGLYSIGMLILPMSALLALRAWRWQDWQSQGSWWGGALILFTWAVARVQWTGAFDFKVQLANSIFFSAMPTGLLIFLYFSGAVIFFGGMPAWRRARFPLLLVLLVNPCPEFVTRLLDEPLQAAGAHLARSFAHLLGVTVEGDLLHLMFTPESTVFIAPGCDGLRGVLTLGLSALVVGHWFRLRPQVHALYVLAAVLAAYVLNLLRLCVVVAYSALSAHLSQTWFEQGELFDFIAGGLMFLGTAIAFLNWPRRHPELCVPNSSS